MMRTSACVLLARCDHCDAMLCRLWCKWNIDFGGNDRGDFIEISSFSCQFCWTVIFLQSYRNPLRSVMNFVEHWFRYL